MITHNNTDTSPTMVVSKSCIEDDQEDICSPLKARSKNKKHVSKANSLLGFI